MSLEMDEANIEDLAFVKEKKILALSLVQLTLAKRYLIIPLPSRRKKWLIINLPFASGGAPCAEML